MKKIKTLRSAAKRLKKTASGHFKHKRSNLRHILTKKASKRRRHLRHKSLISKADLSTVLSYLPYSIN